MWFAQKMSARKSVFLFVVLPIDNQTLSSDQRACQPASSGVHLFFFICYFGEQSLPSIGNARGIAFARKHSK
jgi:hypothetical protein